MTGCDVSRSWFVVSFFGISSFQGRHLVAKRKSPEVAIEEFGTAESDLRLRRKLKISENETKQVKARLSASEAEVESLQKRIEVFTELGAAEAKPVKFGKASNRKGQATAMLLLSDLHVEERVDAEKVNWLNEYTLDIAEKSLNEVFQRALMLLEHERALVNINELVIFLGGDNVSSRIHLELIETGQLPPLAACRWVQERLEGGIRFLCEHAGVKKVRIVTSYGNHGRTTEKRRIATGSENSYEYDMYQIMRSSMSSPLLEWNISKGYLNYIDIQGYTCRFHHGDAMRYHGAIGGITTTVEKANRSWDQQIKADYSFCGHYHQHRVAPHWVMNGSLIGYSPFAVEIKAEFEEPSQTFCVIDKDRGMTVAKKVFCRPPYKKAVGSR